MRRLNMLIVMTAMVLVAAGSAKGNTSLGPLRWDKSAVMASGQSSLPVMKSEKGLSKTVLQAAKESKVAQLFVAVTADDGKPDGKNNPPPRSTHCPPDKGNHQDNGQKGSDNQNTDNQNNSNKDKNHHDDCGKGNDGKNS